MYPGMRCVRHRFCTASRLCCRPYPTSGRCVHLVFVFGRAKAGCLRAAGQPPLLASRPACRSKISSASDTFYLRLSRLCASRAGRVRKGSGNRAGSPLSSMPPPLPLSTKTSSASIAASESSAAPWRPGLSRRNRRRIWCFRIIFQVFQRFLTDAAAKISFGSLLMMAESCN